MDGHVAEWEDKCWGRVLHLFRSPHAVVSWLQVRAGTRCSLHFHADRHNLFLVTRGVVCIESWQFSDCVAREVLRAGETTVVPAGVLHRFRVLEQGEMIEVYSPLDNRDVRHEDIFRRDAGGADELEGLLAELRHAGLYDGGGR